MKHAAIAGAVTGKHQATPSATFTPPIAVTEVVRLRIE